MQHKTYVIMFWNLSSFPMWLN